MAVAMRPHTRTWAPICAILFASAPRVQRIGGWRSWRQRDGGRRRFRRPERGGRQRAKRRGALDGIGRNRPRRPLGEICFNLNEDGTALTQADQPVHHCQSVSLQISFQECNGSLAYGPDVPVIDGAFRLVDPRGYFDISGSFDGLTASGEGAILVDGELCSGDWEATPLD